MKLSLEYWKREKNFVALLEKGYVRDPEGYPFWFLVKRLKREVDELEHSILGGIIPEVTMECADVSNILDYINSKNVMDYPDKYIPLEEEP